jgi:hypothetical protein
VHPGHGAGSLCGTGIAPEPSSTIGRERQQNPLLRHAAKAAFVAEVLGDLPDTPPYFARMKRVNREGPPILNLANAVDAPPTIDAREAARLVARGALLLERLGRPLYKLDLPVNERHEILVSAAERVWRPAPDCGLPTGAHKARWLAEFVERMWEELEGPCSRRAVEHALACAARRGAAHRDETAVLVHGDIHQWNALEADEAGSVGVMAADARPEDRVAFGAPEAGSVGVRAADARPEDRVALGAPEGFKLVDPDGLLAEPEYDLGIIMREDPLEGDLRERARRLAERTGLDEDAIWEWGVVERVSTGLLATRVGLQPVGSEMLAAADAVAA